MTQKAKEFCKEAPADWAKVGEDYSLVLPEVNVGPFIRAMTVNTGLVVGVDYQLVPLLWAN